MSEWKKVFENNVSLYCRIIIQYLIKSGWKCISIDDYTKKMPDFPVREAVLSKFYKKGGLFPIVSQSKDLISGFSDDEKLLNKISEPIIIFGDHTQVVKYIDFDFVLGADGTKILTVTNDYNPKFLYYLIKSIDLHSNKYARHYSKLRKEKIPFQENSLSLQIKIASFLDSLENNNISDEPYFDKETQKKILSLQKNSLNIQLIEKEIESQKNYIKQLRQNILQEAIEGKLTADWRKQNPVQKDNPDYDAEALFAQIQEEKKNLLATKELKKGNLPKAIRSNKDLLKYPDSWKWARIDDLFFVTKLAGFEFTEYFHLTERGDIPVVRAQNVRDLTLNKSNLLYIDSKTSELLERSALTKPSLLVTFIGAGIGDVGIFEEKERWHLAPNVAKLEPLKNCEKLISIKLIALFMLSSFGQKEIFKYMKATAQPSLSMESIRDICFPLPPLAEQNEIVTRVENHLQTVSDLENQITKREQLIKQLMQSILKDAFEER